MTDELEAYGRALVSEAFAHEASAWLARRVPIGSRLALEGGAGL